VEYKKLVSKKENIYIFRLQSLVGSNITNAGGKQYIQSKYKKEKNT
jgi:hypothetical protein